MDLMSFLGCLGELNVSVGSTSGSYGIISLVSLASLPISHISCIRMYSCDG